MLQSRRVDILFFAFDPHNFLDYEKRFPCYVFVIDQNLTIMIKKYLEKKEKIISQNLRIFHNRDCKCDRSLVVPLIHKFATV